MLAGDDEPEVELRPIGIWGQRRLRYLKEHRHSLYTALLLEGKLNDHLADTDEQAERMLSELVKQMAQRQGITEALKASDQMLWVQRMNNIRNAAQEIVLNGLIYE
jgi:polyhydroxyalkanoate synthesis regulator phasin